MLKNARPYLITHGYKIDPALLARRPAVPCGPFDRSTDGFIDPCDHSIAPLMHTIGEYSLICWQTEERILPSSVVLDALQTRLDELEETTGFRPGRKETREIREQIETELLPRAFIQKKRTYAAITDDYLIIDTASATRADSFIAALQTALGELPLLLLATHQRPAHGMTQWLALGECPDVFDIARSCVLESIDDESGKIQYKNMNLDADDIRERISGNHTVTKLELTFDNRMSFHLNDGMVLTKLALLDVVKEQVAQGEDKQSLFDSEWLVSIDSTKEAIDAVIRALGGMAAREADLLKEAA